MDSVTLEGQYVRLEPLSLDHFDGLWTASQGAGIWQWTLQVISTPDDLHEYIEVALARREAGTQLPFATIERSTGTVVGCTRFDAIDETHRGLEIGWTWIHPHWQRTAINTEAKFLMLRHAFEDWRAIRVQLKTDSLNEKSRAAIGRLGARFEGIIRNHMIVAHSGRIRHSALFSITREEWPTVKNGLLEKLSR